MMNVVCAHNCKDCFAMRVCAVNAFEETPETISVDPDKCIGCGVCKTVCVAFGFKALEKKAVNRLMGEAAA